VNLINPKGDALHIAPGTRVNVYMNLNRAKRGLDTIWSVQVGGKVVGYCDRCTVANATPKVSASGHRRIVEKGHREVYAKIEGEWAAPTTPADGELIRCNPFRQAEFTRENGDIYTGSAFASFGKIGGFLAH
jgi:nitrite reductase/ring-hydroxylating ferredoxin subunit